MSRNRSPLALAQELQALKVVYKTNKAVSVESGLSESQVSRYIALLSLPDEIQAQVDAGLLPLENPMRAHKRKTATARSKKVIALSSDQNQIIQLLARNVFITQAQAARYLNKSLTTIRYVLNGLVSTRFLEVHQEIRPYVYRLANHGAAVAGVTKPRHWMSGNAIHQLIMRNEVELQLRSKNASASFVPRLTCWSMGLFPAVAEHLFTYERGDSNERALVMIDDYMMSPERCLHSLTRLHDENKSVTKGRLVLKWQDAINTMLIYSTNKDHCKRHESFIVSNRSLFPKAVEVRYIPPIWEIM